ncbi:MAG TPA: DNA polymerase III subunit delta [Candidatus Pacearchaeota archaeon]|nr:DNA polymerase III subunit delta [Candidatus Pacearchaeota archaeon]HQM24529.1 DNA polymerase III subunit delta [Candidatus Pacearchaeota archaeon]
MIIFLFGEDTYRLKEKLREIIEEYKKKNTSGFNLRFLDAKEILFDDFKSELLSISMFKEKKLVVLSNIFSASKFKEDFLERGEPLFGSENILIIYEPGNVSQKEKLATFLKKKAKTEEFKFLRTDQVKRFIKKKLEQKEISDDALSLLIDFCSNDLWKISKEIEKLINYSKSKILKEDIELLVSPVYDNNIFETIDAIAKKEKKKAIKLLKRHIEDGDSVPYLLTMIAYQLKNIISVKSSKKVAMNPFVLSKSLSQANNFSIEELKALYEKVAFLDADIKTGRVNPEFALDLLVFDI